MKQQQSEIGKQLHAALSHRIKERRTSLSSIVYYLYNSQVTSLKIPDFFVANTSAQNQKITINLIKRLNSADIITLADVNSDSDVQLNEALSSKEGYNKIKTISEELNEVMEKGLVATQTLPTREESITSKIQKEMSLFERGATRSNHFQKAYDYILSIRPTSVDVRTSILSGLVFMLKKSNAIKRQNDRRFVFFKVKKKTVTSLKFKTVFVPEIQLYLHRNDNS